MSLALVFAAESPFSGVLVVLGRVLRPLIGPAATFSTGWGVPGNWASGLWDSQKFSLVVLVGLALPLAAAGYALKALKGAMEHRGSAKATLRHFYPL